MFTNLQVYHLALINLCRSNPGAYAASLNIDLNEGLDPGTILDYPRPPLIINSDLNTLAINHTQDMIDNDFFAHTSPTTGYTPEERFDLSPYSYTNYGENLSAWFLSADVDDFIAAKQLFDQLFIDADYPGRGHRLNILRHEFKEFGTGQLEGEYAGYNYSQLLTQTFGAPSQALNYLVGNLIQDSNANGEYDAGEGLSGVLVEAKINDTVVASTTTDTDGYYALALDPGTHTIIAYTSGHNTETSVEMQSASIRKNLFWDPVITTEPSGELTVSSNQVVAAKNSPELAALEPVNVVATGVSSYILYWNFSNANIVKLDGVSVGASGSLEVQSATSITHTIEVAGPAGLVTSSVYVSASLFTPFKSGVQNSSTLSDASTYDGQYNSPSYPGEVLDSGLHPLYGPSNLQRLGILNAENLYVRIAIVKRISIVSRELDIVFIDGKASNTSLYRGEAVFGAYNNNPEHFDVPVPSASILSVGDRVAVVIDGSKIYIVSRLDRIEYPNNNRVAVYPGNILYAVLSKLCLCAYCTEDSFSYADFIDPETLKVTRIQHSCPNLESNRIAYRLLYELAFTHQQNLNVTHVDSGTYPYETTGGGVLPTQPVIISGTTRHGTRINNVPYVIDMPYGQADNSSGLSIYDYNLTKVNKGSCHPLTEATIDTFYNGATVMWFDDPDPEWVLLAVVYPSWELTKTIKFVEVHVNGWSEIARNDSEDSAVTLEDVLNCVEYKQYANLVREVKVIPRNWIDWSTFENSIFYTEQLHRALCIPAKKVGPNTYKFVIQDGYGYSNGTDIVYGACEQKILFGTVTRSVRESTLATNGSPYDYEITNDDPNATYTDVSLIYELEYKYYNDAAGTEYEYQRTTEAAEKKNWVVYTNGVNQLFKKISIDYNCAGHYTRYPWMPGQSWNGDLTYVDSINNSLSEYLYWDSTANKIFEYKFDLVYDAAIPEFTVTQSLPAFHYVNIELGLFVYEQIDITLTNSDGPGYHLTGGYRERIFKVWYKGVTYTLFSVLIPYNIGTDIFPDVYNFWPWSLDAGIPQKPSTAPYDSTYTDSSIFYLSPFANYYVSPKAPYLYTAMSYPSAGGDVSSTLLVSAFKTDSDDYKADYLQVFIDPKTSSWAVTVKNIISVTGTRSISFPDGGGDQSMWVDGVNTLYKIGAAAPTFIKPDIDETINLWDSYA